MSPELRPQFDGQAQSPEDKAAAYAARCLQAAKVVQQLRATDADDQTNYSVKNGRVYMSGPGGHGYL